MGSFLDDKLFQQLIQHSTICDQVRLHAVSLSSDTSSDWVKALPQPSLGLAISPRGFMIALRLWLGIPLFFLSPMCTCISVIDHFDDHLLCFSHGPLRIQHHDVLISVVHHALLQDHPGVLQEQVSHLSTALVQGIFTTEIHLGLQQNSVVKWAL